MQRVAKPHDLVSPAEWVKKISQERDVNLLQVLLPMLLMAQRVVPCGIRPLQICPTTLYRSPLQ